jgi:Ca2+-transporting ATPase
MGSYAIERESGLTESEASERLRSEGPNELPRRRRSSNLAIVFDVAREPMFLLLVACGAVYLAMGEPKEALMLLSFVFVIMGVTIIQERRTERALEALRDLSSPRALVIRDGQQKRIPGREVVRGDRIFLAEGDRVPADAVLRQAVNLSADESLLTGESVPVRKAASVNCQAMDRPGGDDLPSVFSGSLITRGHGIAEVLATGVKTEIGKIGKALQVLEPERTLLQKETGRLVRNLAVVGLSLCAVVVVMYGLTRGNTALVWKEALLAGITMAMAILPEEFPVVLTIFLALGAWRISCSRVLTRRIPVVETLGAATILCVDKTGTLTQNRMSVSKLVVGEETIDASSLKDLPESSHELVEFGILASKKGPFDPMEKALKDLGSTRLARTEHLHAGWELVREYPLSPELLALSHVWRDPKGGNLMIAAKGAPEAILDLCHVTPARAQIISQHVAGMAADGLRVLGVARGLPQMPAGLPTHQHDFTFEFLGLISLADPIRPAVPEAVKECHAAGIRIMMITGDYPGTAQSIGRQIGLPTDQMLTGPELEAMSDEQLRARVRQTSIVARAVPEHKLRIVQALKANGEVVAMTGDGVNDAPALKAAHIGIAMGGRGTDVARESAGLVLLDDDFSSIVKAVHMGRRIFDNIKKAVSYIFAIHVPIAGLSLIPVFFRDWPLILLPVHILFLELIIDPSCTLIFEAEEAEPNAMSRPPRSPSERLFGLKSLAVSLLQGFGALAAILGVFLAARALGYGADGARGLTFTALVAANLSLILTNRSWSRTALGMLRVPNTALWWVLSGAAAFLSLVLWLPPLQSLFHFSPLPLKHILISLAAGAGSIAWFELFKVMRNRRHGGRIRLPDSQGVMS